MTKLDRVFRAVEDNDAFTDKILMMEEEWAKGVRNNVAYMIQDLPEYYAYREVLHLALRGSMGSQFKMYQLANKEQLSNLKNKVDLNPVGVTVSKEFARFAGDKKDLVLIEVVVPYQAVIMRGRSGEVVVDPNDISYSSQCKKVIILGEVKAYKHQGKYVVRNKESGNIYAVDEFNPEHHEKISKDEIKAWAQKERGKPDIQNPSTAASIVGSLNKASKAIADHRRRTRAIFDRYPDGTEVEGWRKQTVAGDIFWMKGKKVVIDPSDEIGPKKASKFTGIDMYNPPSRLPSLRSGTAVGEVEQIREVKAYKYKGKYVVKNKDSGNIYTVITFDPQTHEKVGKDEAQAWAMGQKGSKVHQSQIAKQSLIPSEEEKAKALAVFGDPGPVVSEPTKPRSYKDVKKDVGKTSVPISKLSDQKDREKVYQRARRFSAPLRDFLKKSVYLPSKETEIIHHRTEKVMKEMKDQKVFRDFAGEGYEFESYRLSKLVRDTFYPKMPSDFRTQKTIRRYEREGGKEAEKFKRQVSAPTEEDEKEKLREFMSLQQKSLQESGLVDNERVTVYRGFRIGGDDAALKGKISIEYPGSPADSWSFHPEVARKFLDPDDSGGSPVGQIKGRILKAKVPLGKVVASCVGNVDVFDYPDTEFECVVDSVNLEGVEMFDKDTPLNDEELLKEQKRNRIRIRVENELNMDWIRKLKKDDGQSHNLTETFNVSEENILRYIKKDREFFQNILKASLQCKKVIDLMNKKGVLFLRKSSNSDTSYFRSAAIKVRSSVDTPMRIDKYVEKFRRMHFSSIPSRQKSVFCYLTKGEFPYETEGIGFGPNQFVILPKDGSSYFQSLDVEDFYDSYPYGKVNHFVFWDALQYLNLEPKEICEKKADGALEDYFREGITILLQLKPGNHEVIIEHKGYYAFSKSVYELIYEWFKISGNSIFDKESLDLIKETLKGEIKEVLGGIE